MAFLPRSLALAPAPSVGPLPLNLGTQPTVGPDGDAPSLLPARPGRSRFGALQEALPTPRLTTNDEIEPAGTRAQAQM